MSPVGSERNVRSRILPPAAIGATVVVLLVIWWWPGLTGRGAGSDVTVVGTGQITAARQEVSRRLREEGLSLIWEDSVTNWCDLAAVVEDSETVVVAPEDLQPCDQGANRLDESTFPAGLARHLVLVSLDPAPSSLEGKGARRVPTDRLIGAVDEPLPCVWWDDCPASGTVVTRAEDGLTAAGRQRLARLIATRVP